MNNGSKGIFETPLDAVSKLFDLNVTSAFAAGAQAAEIMRRQGTGGSIINNTSIAALAPDGSLGAHGAAKAALQNLTTAWSVELARLRIRVNAVAPGGVETANTILRTGTPEQRAIEVSKIPMGWLGSPTDAAACFLFFTSDESRFVSGATLLLAGGRTHI
ncbi:MULTISPECIES: SDR family NAD(P)-dependent oxidoreductase [Rhodococcus]|uniref:SDR family oxidoreductase n=1 Tax=Rhodococcus oxybenzonivorans TaxID=1990687 RepID=A0AAE4UZB3_9NOCA|nr:MULTISPECIES: SDR family oxidoreductase [Rhodococcus]MDV7240552.1 SDR family oxidoreductase [Rhodococcus oxybenzonivorans]MDV7265753.1 SDR family oxidoreductase [Rhodococcus oxybenzonivorans]MDV7272825.1 SDR family oxidoreductase [Rhodococcus oxybenzonivorans]MDV7333436.1 SDR family oxidoreductase [Rhodococcus oxybenzonivorans]MDV7342603.1 SDR family oxidoreductase [Rhodococcus oxybenzonivorans]